jgi:hypothetical protein
MKDDERSGEESKEAYDPSFGRGDEEVLQI